MKRSSVPKNLSPVSLPNTPKSEVWNGLNNQQQTTPPTPPSNQKLKFSVDNILNLAGQQQQEETNVNGEFKLINRN